MNYNTRDLERVFERLRSEAVNDLWPNFSTIPDSFDREFFEEWYYARLHNVKMGERLARWDEETQKDERAKTDKVWLLEGGSYMIVDGEPKAVKLSTDHIIEEFKSEVQNIYRTGARVLEGLTKALEGMYEIEV